MPKIIKDLNKGKKPKKLNLKAKKIFKNALALKKNKNVLYKSKTPIKKIKDIRGKKEDNYIYIKGDKYNPPRFLGNLLKVGFIGFFILMVINTLNIYATGKNLEKNISNQAYEGYTFLLDAGKNATKIQFKNAVEAFENAINEFNEASDDLWFVTTDQTFYAENQGAAQAASALIEGGKNFALAGSYFLEALEHFNNIPLYFVSTNIDSNEDKPSITDTLKLGLEETDLAIEEINLAKEKLDTVDESILPSEISVKITYAKSKINEISEFLNSLSEHFPAILKLLGDRYPHRYLIILQNNNEIRPTVGFIGSYAIMDIDEGYIEKLQVHDVYDIDGSYGGYIEPPEVLENFTANWRFRDGNYSPDFPTSAKKLIWMFQKEGGPSVDSVIAINQGLLKTMLEITGPVQVGNFGALDSENYNLLLSYVIEGKIWGEEDPKHILKIFIPAFKEAILKEENISSVGSKIYRAIQQKHIMMYSPDVEIQSLFENFGLSGTVYRNEKDEDYLSVIHSSIGGTKSDQFIEETILHHTDIDKYGNIINEVTIKREHTWTEKIYYYWKNILKKYGLTEMPDQIIDILGRGLNKVNSRIYVPAGSVLLESNSEDIETLYDKDLKKTFFFFEMEANAGETDEITVKYRIPFTLDFKEPADTYKLIIEKQPGSLGSIFTKTVEAEEDIYNLGLYPEEARMNIDDVMVYNTNLVFDRYFSAIFSK